MYVEIDLCYKYPARKNSGGVVMICSERLKINSSICLLHTLWKVFSLTTILHFPFQVAIPAENETNSVLKARLQKAFEVKVVNHRARMKKQPYHVVSLPSRFVPAFGRDVYISSLQNKHSFPCGNKVTFYS